MAGVRLSFVFFCNTMSVLSKYFWSQTPKGIRAKTAEKLSKNICTAFGLLLDCFCVLFASFALLLPTRELPPIMTVVFHLVHLYQRIPPTLLSMVLSTEKEDTQRAIDMDIAKRQADIKEKQAVIEKHRIAILALKYQRNRLAFISRLPPETLSHIIAFVKVAQYPSILNSLAWIKVTHVSTHWRDVAMNSPTLWNDPPIERVEWRQIMLRRSKMASLTIKTDFSYDSVSLKKTKKTGLRDILRHHGSRIKHLAITGVDPECLKILEDLPVSISRLETLYLRAYHSLGTRGDISIPNRILTDSKNLREVKLHRLSGLNFLRWDLFFLSNITHLQLHDTAESASLTWTQFMGALKKMTKLERLILGNILDSTKNIEDDTLSLGLVRLCRLESLTMKSPTREVETFFRHVTFPPSATVEVVAIYRSGPNSEITNIISNVAALYSSSSLGSEFQSLSMAEHGSISSFRLSRKIIENFSDTQNYFVLSLTFLTYNIAPAALVIPEFFSGGFLLNKVSHVLLDTCSLDSAALARTIGALPALSRINAKEQGAVPLIKALCFRSNAADALSFANLVTIKLTNVPFISKRKDVYSNHELDPELLKDCLEQRRACGAEITNLVLQICFDLKASDVLELQGIVAHVDWDGKKDCWEDDDDDSDGSETESSDEGSGSDG